MKKVIFLLVTFTFLFNTAHADSWPHKDSKGNTVRHFIVINHLDKKINVIMSGQKNFAMKPGDSLMFE
jgi:hypothetical protein